MSETRRAKLQLVEQRPDPSHLWIRYRPRRWPSASGLWVDLASGRLNSLRAPRSSLFPDSVPEVSLDDLLYLPPTTPEARSKRDRLIETLGDRGIPILVQLREEQAPVGVETVVCDILESVLDRDLDRLRELPNRSAVVWPLIAGYSDSEDLWRSAIDLFVAAGVECVQGIVLDLDAADRRRIVDRAGDWGFDALFRGDRPSERDFSRMVAEAGLRPFLPRPLPIRPRWLHDNRRLAEILYLCAEIWLRLDLPEATGQALFTTARRVDSEKHDLTSLCREGNLNIVEWLDPMSREIIEGWSQDQRSTTLESLMERYFDETTSDPNQS